MKAKINIIYLSIGSFLFVMLPGCTDAGSPQPVETGILHKTYDLTIYSFVDSSFKDSTHFVYIDINDDAVYDLKLYSPKFSGLGGIGNQGQKSSIQGVNGTSISADPFGQIDYTGTFPFIAKPYHINVPISSADLYQAEEMALDFLIFADMWDCCPVYGLKMIGVQLLVNGEIHYAWVSFLLTATPEKKLGSMRFTSNVKVLESGYNRRLNEPINAGTR